MKSLSTTKQRIGGQALRLKLKLVNDVTEMGEFRGEQSAGPNSNRISNGCVRIVNFSKPIGVTFGWMLTHQFQVPGANLSGRCLRVQAKDFEGILIRGAHGDVLVCQTVN